MNSVNTVSHLTILSYLVLTLGVCLGFFGLASPSIAKLAFFLTMLSIPLYLFGKVIEAIKENTNTRIDIFNESKDDMPVIIRKNVI
ncbi:hypothetical protein [Photobacterium lutimaris]|uniref:Uncharacterized protein n=1 Tax=Photobacterium lutimaris TaxID=388278 RepID=A0A2T3IYM5_9GAMM|nr:hypothetical protein [Photobacterium lutimaris]PSU33697.1 hypothetical protein C9I99_13090 [Photobacterium lutimaris]TDR74448.1 hypothetical protein DFP78_10735 [Photobacterium lutimaris]